VRRELKERLLRKYPNCDWCMLPLLGDCDMHEWLVKRNVLPKDQRIFDERNCSLLHHGCHMEHGKTKAMQQRLAEVFVGRYGKEAMLAFVDGLELKAPAKFHWLLFNVVV